MEKPETLGERLRRLRQERGLSQRELCMATRYSYTYVSRIESGERTPSLRAVRVLARRLKVSPFYLEFGRPDPERERMWSLLEIAKFWRDRSRFLERRLAEFEARMTGDPSTLDGQVLGEVTRLRKLVGGAAEVEVAQSE